MRVKHRVIIFGWVLLVGIGMVAISCMPSPTPRPTPASPTIVPLLPSATASSTLSSQDMEQTPTLTKTPHPTRTPTEPPAETYTPSPEPTSVPPGEPTPTPAFRGVEDAPPPPFDITLPDGWDKQYNELGVLRPDGETMDVKVAFYSGAIDDGLHEAVILVLWDYPSINEDVWKDGIELVGVVFDPSCQFSMVGMPTAQTYLLGLHYAEGIPFEVEACSSPSDPDVTGWLVGYRRAETNYLFYIRIAPPDGSEEAAAYVQSILETIRFSGES
jgi:hypothetical protein